MVQNIKRTLNEIDKKDTKENWNRNNLNTNAI